MQLCFIYKFVTLVEKYRNSVTFTFTPGFKQFSGGTNRSQHGNRHRRFVLFTLVKFKLFCKIERKLYVSTKDKKRIHTLLQKLKNINFLNITLPVTGAHFVSNAQMFEQ